MGLHSMKKCEVRNARTALDNVKLQKTQVTAFAYKVVATWLRIILKKSRCVSSRPQ